MLHVISRDCSRAGAPSVLIQEGLKVFRNGHGLKRRDARPASIAYRHPNS